MIMRMLRWMDTPRLPPGRLIFMSRVKLKAKVDFFKHMLAYVMYITTYLNPNMIFFGA